MDKSLVLVRTVSNKRWEGGGGLKISPKSVRFYWTVPESMVSEPVLTVNFITEKR